MYIEHLAIWCKDLETMKDFYIRYFDGIPNNKYHNSNKQFSSYFLSFEKGPRIELMQMPGIPGNLNDVMQQFMGLIHFAVSVGSEEKVNTLTERLRTDGFVIVGEPRRTGDGYYESVILDPEGNRIEITA
ncbi:MAG: VOC family protein [Bacteroidota bacterium]